MTGRFSPCEVTQLTEAIIRVQAKILEQLLAEARREPQQECCGLLAGKEGVISRLLPARNALASASAFEIAPQELFAMVRRIRADGLELLGIYHSHPRGENAPSPRDIASAFYPAAAYFILSPRPETALPIRAFHIRDGRVSELTLRAE
jgi:proteasome lid subunit RPN8/RPN11